VDTEDEKFFSSVFLRAFVSSCFALPSLLRVLCVLRGESFLALAFGVLRGESFLALAFGVLRVESFLPWRSVSSAARALFLLTCGDELSW
jgi:hypothetical protein